MPTLSIPAELFEVTVPVHREEVSRQSPGVDTHAGAEEALPGCASKARDRPEPATCRPSPAYGARNTPLQRPWGLAFGVTSGATGEGRRESFPLELNYLPARHEAKLA
ncbi:unnamed protein product [Pipistrellus nathusii]|uniref:Uncharacterized protein n=1 Tax=Pipistrellus nathusii TaxID=59473 RepID=A0ABP0AJ92_PIPNA